MAVFIVSQKLLLNLGKNISLLVFGQYVHCFQNFKLCSSFGYRISELIPSSFKIIDGINPVFGQSKHPQLIICLMV